MFTGIVRGKGTVRSIEDRAHLRSLTVVLPEGYREGVEQGASIAVNGVCLTVAGFDEQSVSFDVMAESLHRTTLGMLGEGDSVNVERAAREGAEIGGHPISGHVDCVCRIVSIERPENNVMMTFEVPQEFTRYIFSKGYVALNGASLTVSNVDKKAGTFQVWFINETLRLTTFGESKEGMSVNLEIERGTQVVVDTVYDFLEQRFTGLLPQLQKLLDQ